MLLFSNPQQQPSPFQFPNQHQQQQSFFSQQPQPWQQQQQQQQQQQLFLFTKDRSPASYSTKWEDLHPDSHKVLLQIEEKILEHRDECQRLGQCSRLFVSSVSNDTFDVDAARVVQELGGINTSIERQKAVLQALMTMVKDMLWNTEVAVRSFMMLQPRFLHAKGRTGSNATMLSQAPGITTAPAPANSLGPVIDFYSGLPRKPSVFMQQTVIRFEKYLGECRQWIEELEQLILSDSEQNCSNFNSLLQSLPKVLSNVHDFFIHVAAKVESIHHYIESMRAAYLADQRRRGEGNNPFLEADRRETAKEEAAAKRVHPTVHLPALPQPSTQTAGLFSSSVTPSGPLTAPQTSSAALPSSSGSEFSLVGASTTSLAPVSSSGLFATPVSVPASSSSLFATPASSPASPFITASGASPQKPFPNLASSTGTAASFGSSATGGSTLFSTPFASGAATGSGASFGNATRSRPRPRTSRR